MARWSLTGSRQRSGHRSGHGSGRTLRAGDKRTGVPRFGDPAQRGASGEGDGVAEREPEPSARLTPGAVITVASTKFDGSLHYEYPGTVVADHGHRLLVWAAAGTPMRSYRGERNAPRHLLRIHEAGRDWNLEVWWERNWRPYTHYVNIALPSTWHDGTLRFVDLDLDVSLWPDGRALLLDADEFADHRERFDYPRWLVDRAWAAVDEVRGLISREQPPFDGAFYDWRPPSGWGGDAPARDQ